MPESYRLAFGARERHAVVTGHHDDRVVELAHLLEACEQLTDLAVESPDLPVVVRVVVANFLCVRIVLEQMDLADIDAALGTRSRGVGTVRVTCHEPEAERHVVGASGEEFFDALVALTSRVGGAVRVLPWSPALAIATLKVSFAGEHLGVFGKLGRPDAPEIASRLETPELLACQDRAAAGRAGRRRDEGVLEQHSLIRQPIERRRLDGFIAVGTRVRPTPVVRDGENNVGPARRNNWKSAKECNQRGEVCRSRRHANEILVLFTVAELIVPEFHAQTDAVPSLPSVEES